MEKHNIITCLIAILLSITVLAVAIVLATVRSTQAHAENGRLIEVARLGGSEHPDVIVIYDQQAKVDCYVYSRYHGGGISCIQR